jgi:PIN domain nuclease of toxin-antitoxin system
MRVLLDTCEFLWYVSGNTRLSVTTRTVIEDSDNEVFLSVVSLWEILVKYSQGKLPLPQSPELYVPIQRLQHRIASLPLDEASVQKLAGLPDHHRDPFDRMLICQAQAHELLFASSDAVVRRYSVAFLD